MAKTPKCPQPQCQDTEDIKKLHAGYVRHRNNDENPCDASTKGHNEYMRQLRLARQKAKQES